METDHEINSEASAVFKNKGKYKQIININKIGKNVFVYLNSRLV
jgi:hypothetical protein